MPFRALVAFASSFLLILTTASMALAIAPSGTDAAAHAYVRVVRIVEPADVGLSRIEGLTYASDSRSLIGSGTRADGIRILSSFSLIDEPLGSAALPASTRNARSIAYDPAAGAVLIAAATDTFTSVAAPAGRPSGNAVEVRHVAGATAGAAAGIAVSGVTPMILDERGTVSTLADTTGAPRVARRLSLGGPHAGLRGLAVEANGHLFSLAPTTGTLYEFDANGMQLATRDLSGMGLESPESMVIAPTADTSDDPSLTSLYVADAGTADGSGSAIYELALTAPALSPQLATASASSVTLLNTVRTGSGSTLDPDSPDPSGLAYIPTDDAEVPIARRGLVIVDGEVEEVTGAGWHNVNVWFAPTDGGAQTATLDTTKADPVNKEPVGAAYDPVRNELYIGKDGSNGQVWVYDAADMTQVRTFSITGAPYNIADGEGLAFANPVGGPVLYAVDAVDNDLVKIQAGNDGTAGTSDDVVTNYDLEQYGQTEPEGIDVHPDTGNIWVVSNRLHNGTSDPMVEVTPTGQLVSTVSIDAANPNSAAGLAIAPPSAGGAGWSIYVSDRGVDNNDSSGENDGQIYEFSVDGTAPPSAPDTVIDTGPSGTQNTAEAAFSFHAIGTSTGFECRLDAESFAACASPKSYTGLADGAHSFSVRALNGTTVDATPATQSWTISTGTPSPDTVIDSGPSGTVNTSEASFAFHGTGTVTGFECKLDAGSFGACTSPKNYTALTDGPHTFSVRAVDGTTADPSPATRTWTISTATSANLIRNPGFELDEDGNTVPDDWGSKTKFRQSTAVVHGGTFSGQHVATNNSGWTVFQDVAATAGSTYTFDGFVDVPATADAFTFQFKIRWMNGASPLKTIKIQAITAATGGWVLQSSGPIVAPAGTTLARVMMTTKSVNGSIYVDDLSFAPSP